MGKLEKVVFLSEQMKKTENVTQRIYKKLAQSKERPNNKS